MPSSVLYVSRLLRLPLLDGDGATIGRVDDMVIGPPARGGAPVLLGLVASVTRRRSPGRTQALSRFPVPRTLA